MVSIRRGEPIIKLMLPTTFAGEPKRVAAYRIYDRAALGPRFVEPTGLIYLALRPDKCDGMIRPPEKIFV